MHQTAETGMQALASEGQKPLRQQIAEAVRCRTTPISRLLRLMSALDAQESANENLRLQLRARIGAPLSA